MKQSCLILALLLGIVGTTVFGQENETVVRRIEVDFKEIQTDYKVNFIKADGSTIEAIRTNKGFSVPQSLRNDDKLTIVFSFKDYVLNFSDVERYWFDGEWVVGVDLKPFTHKLVNRRDAKKSSTVYYVEFTKSGLQSGKVIMRSTGGSMTSIEPLKKAREKSK